MTPDLDVTIWLEDEAKVAVSPHEDFAVLRVGESVTLHTRAKLGRSTEGRAEDLSRFHALGLAIVRAVALARAQDSLRLEEACTGNSLACAKASVTTSGDAVSPLETDRQP